MIAGTWPLQAGAVVLAILGVLSLARRGNRAVTILFAASVFVLAGGQLTAAALLRAPATFGGSRWELAAAILLVTAGITWPALSYSLGRGEGFARLRRATPFLLAWGAAGTVLVATHWPLGTIVVPAAGEEGAARIVLQPSSPWFLSWLLVSLVAVVTNFEATLRTTTGTARRRLRLMLLALTGAIALHVLPLAQALLYHSVPLTYLAWMGWAVFAAAVLAAYCLLRHRVSDLSVPAARPVVYSAVTTTVIGGYLLMVAVVDELTRRFGLDASAVWTTSTVALALGLLGIAVFAPRLSRWVRQFVDRNLYAQRFDHRREWSRVSRHLNPSDPLPQLARSVADLVRSMIGATDVQVLVRNGQSTLESIAWSADPSRPDGRSPRAISAPLDSSIAGALRQAGKPLLLEGRQSDLDGISLFVEGAQLWGESAPALAVGLLVDHELVGALLLGPKTRGEKYNAEEVDLLDTMSHQLAHVLWARRLSDELVETRELESFHRLASLVLHDLKTIVSGLSLTLQNAQRQWENPAVHESTLRSVASSVDRMKELMERVAQARTPEGLSMEACDVDELVSQSLEEAMDPSERTRIRVLRRSQGPGRIRVDRGQMAVVFRNLIRNACESMPGGGDLEIRVSVRTSDAGDGSGPLPESRELVISVQDTGVGMESGFVKERLFRPFASTKKRGFGLGLHQSRSIVEAHGGKLEVASVPNEGSEFRVVLPLASEALVKGANT